MPTRPKYLNLVQIRLPLPGFVSILHRVSGALLFLALPLVLCAWQSSVASAEQFAQLRAAFSGGLAKLVLLALAWAFFHHICAGIRYLVMDVGAATELATARLTSKIVLAVSLALTAWVGAKLW